MTKSVDFIRWPTSLRNLTILVAFNKMVRVIKVSTASKQVLTKTAGAGATFPRRCLKATWGWEHSCYDNKPYLLILSQSYSKYLVGHIPSVTWYSPALQSIKKLQIVLQESKLRSMKEFPSLQVHRFPIRTIRQTRFGVLSSCKRNWDLRRSRSLSHLDLEDRHIYQARARSIKTNGTGSREEDFDLLIVRPKQILAPKTVQSCFDKSLLKKSKSMVEILENHKGVIFLSEC